MSEDVELDYSELIQDAQKKAYRFLMQDVLKIVADLGDAPGEHHFFIEFLTNGKNVAIPDHLKSQYPERMTIVLQHQFENLIVTDDQFSVTLWFKGKEAHLVVPYDAVTQFADPSAQFGVSFEAVEEEFEEVEDEDAPEATDSDEPDTDDAEDGDDEKNSDGADIVSLDAFRKK